MQDPAIVLGPRRDWRRERLITPELVDEDASQLVPTLCTLTSMRGARSRAPIAHAHRAL